MSAKKSTRKVTLDPSSNLTKFFKGMKESDRATLLKEIFSQYSVEIKINAVGILVIKSNKAGSERIFNNFLKLNKIKREIFLEDVVKAVEGEVDFVEDIQDTSWDLIELKHARGNTTAIRPKNEKQASAIKNILNNKVTMLMGSAGTGKSVIALAVGLKLLELKRIEKVIISKPVVESGPSIGYLPGDEAQKLMPYILSVMSLITELVGSERRDKLIKDKAIEIQNIGYLRGITLGSTLGKRSSGIYYIVDEAQNITFNEHKLILSRLGDHQENRIVLCGDQKQSDLKSKKDTLSVIHKIISPSKFVGATVFEKNDVVRSEVVKDLLGRIEDFEDGWHVQ